MPVAPIVVPSIGEAITRVGVVTWFKQVGATVARDELVVAITTEKIDLDLAAPIAGTLSEIRVAAGEWVDVGATLGIVCG